MPYDTYVYIYRPVIYCDLPLLIITTITIIIIIKLKIINKRRGNMTHALRCRNKATRVLIVVNIVFVVCSVPWLIALFVRYIGYFSKSNYIFVSINLFYIVNSNVNFLIYTVLSKQYRTVVIHSFKRTCLSTQPENALVVPDMRVENIGQRIARNTRDSPL